MPLCSSLKRLLTKNRLYYVQTMQLSLINVFKFNIYMHRTFRFCEILDRKKYFNVFLKETQKLVYTWGAKKAKIA